MMSTESLAVRTEGTRAMRVALAVRVAVWLAALPVRWHRYDMPTLMRRLDAIRPDPVMAGLDRSVLTHIVQRVSRLRVFSLPLFPRRCLRESLALYYVLRRAGDSAHLLLGVRKEASVRFAAHGWVTVDGVPVVPGDDGHGFWVVYRHPQQTSGGQGIASAITPL